MKLIYITGNHGKFLTAQHELQGTDIEAIQQKLELTEIQSASVEEIAIHKAFQAGRQLKQTVMVQDSGMTIPGLNGFPGPYAAYINQTIGPEGVLAMVDKICPQQRESSFDSVYAIYSPDTDRVKTFTSVYQGTLAHYVSPQNSDISWSPIEKIFIPKGADIPLSEMTREQSRQHSAVARVKDAWVDLRPYLIGLQA